jgi:hypothetical protein
MRRKFSPEGIKKNRNYDTGEISAIIGAKPITIRRWVKFEELEIIQGTENHYLIHGSVLRSFLRDRIKHGKHPLQEDEFFCTKCRTARKSRPGCITSTVTEKRMGHNKLSGIRSGLCETCGSTVNRFFVTSTTDRIGLSDCVVAPDSVNQEIQIHDNI